VTGRGISFAGERQATDGADGGGVANRAAADSRIEGTTFPKVRRALEAAGRLYKG
jgi:hypothetical protein